MPRGFTLIELMVALALTAVLTTIAYPGFTKWLLDSRRDATVMAALHAVHAARQIAATRDESVELCSTLDALQCSGRTDWSTGLLVIGVDDSIHRSLPPLVATQGPTLRSNRASILFEPGTSYASPATITVCDRRGAGSARAVIVSRSGRPRISERDASNRALQC